MLSDPNERSSFSAGTIVFEHNEAMLHNILEKAAAGGAERTSNQQKIADYYASCMDTAAIEQKVWGRFSRSWTASQRSRTRAS